MIVSDINAGDVPHILRRFAGNGDIPCFLLFRKVAIFNDLRKIFFLLYCFWPYMGCNRDFLVSISDSQSNLESYYQEPDLDICFHVYDK